MSISSLLSPFNPSHLTKKSAFSRQIKLISLHTPGYHVVRKWASSNKVIIKQPSFVCLSKKKGLLLSIIVHSYLTTFVAHSSIYTEKNINFVFVFLLNSSQLLDICFPIVFFLLNVVTVLLMLCHNLARVFKTRNL